LVDLAGSERQSHVARSGEERDARMMKEAIEINKSLFTLRQVITALTENSRIRQQSKGPKKIHKTLTKSFRSTINAS